jgi:hypothetical protein
MRRGHEPAPGLTGTHAMNIPLMLTSPLALGTLGIALVLLSIAFVVRRRAGADRILLDAFELGGRMSVDPMEVTGSRLLRRRIERLRSLGLLRSSERGMLVIDQEGLRASVEQRQRLSSRLAAGAVILLAAAALYLFLMAPGPGS